MLATEENRLVKAFDTSVDEVEKILDIIVALLTLHLTEHSANLRKLDGSCKKQTRRAMISQNHPI